MNLEHIKSVYNHNKVVDAQVVGKEFALGCEWVKQNRKAYKGRMRTSSKSQGLYQADNFLFQTINSKNRADVNNE